MDIDKAVGRMLLAVLLSLAGSVFGQVTVNGKVPGDLWRTSEVSGVVEVFHVWGRTATMPVTEAWVNIEGDRISVGAKTDKPIFDGKERDGYFMADMTGVLSDDFPQQIQTITKTEITGVGDNEEIRTTKTAMVVMKDGRPESLVFTCVDYAAFDVQEFVKRMNASGSELAKQSAEGLDQFNKLGFRSRMFQAVFR